MKKIINLVVIFMLSVFSLVIPGLTLEKKVVKADAEVITHQFGGDAGEFETDADNSTGVWSYYSTNGNVASKKAMELNEANDTYTSGAAWYQVNKSGFLHPGDGENNCPTISLKAEKTAKVSIVLTASKDNTDGDGTQASFFINDDDHKIGETIIKDANNSFEIKDVSVTEGDEIFMIIDPRGGTACDGATYKLVITLDPSSVVTHKFGGSDGEFETDADNSTGVWSYYSTNGDVASKKAMELNEAQDTYTSGAAWYQVNKSGFLHPGDGENNCPTIALKAEKSGVATITLKATRDNDDKASGNDNEWNNGTKLSFFVNDDDHAIGETLVVDKNTTYTISDVAINAGDEIYMILNSLNNTACDGATYELEISISEGESKPEKSNVISHKFGGSDGEFETDADNSTGVWSYYSTNGDVASKKAMELNEAQDTYTSGAAWYQVNKSGFLHPGDGENNCPTIALKAEKSGVATITLKATRDNDDKASGNDNEWNNGTKLSFFVNDDDHAIGETLVVDKNTTYTISDVAINAGDEIYMILNSLNNTACDGATYELEISIEPIANIIHKFGGSDGEFETDADNSTGVWSYYSTNGDVASKKAMELNEAQDTYTSGAAWYQVNKSGFLHPGDGENNCPTIALKAEKSGVATITLKATRDNDDKASGNDNEWNNGTKLSFFVNDDDHAIGETLVVDKNTTYTISDVAINAGDEIYMILNSLNNTACDGATYELEISIEPKNNEGGQEPEDPEEPEEPIEDPDDPDEPEEYVPVHPEDPTEEPLEGELESINNIDDFRFYQGAKNLYYYYGKVSEGIDGLQELTAASLQWDTQDAIPYLCIKMDGLIHPGYTTEPYLVALAYKADKAKDIDIYLDSIFETIVDNPGDGVTISIYKNKEVLLTYSITGKDNQYNNSEPISARINRLHVEADDMIYITFDPNNYLANDGMMVYVEFSWVKDTATEPDDPVTPDDSDDKEDEDDKDDKDDEEEPKKKGCSNSVASTSMISLLLALCALLLLKKRKED